MIILRMKNFFLLLSVLCFLLLASCRNNSSEKKNLSEKKSGENNFQTYCTTCHGTDGKLCAMGAKDLSVSPMTKEQMMEIITNGKNRMAAFGNLLSKQEIDSLAVYIQILKK